MLAYCRALYDHAPFLRGVRAVRGAVAASGELHALRQTALKLTVPGVPDIYQGDELVALSLVDPDNRRAGRLGAPARAAGGCARAGGRATRASCG